MFSVSDWKSSIKWLIRFLSLSINKERFWVVGDRESQVLMWGFQLLHTTRGQWLPNRRHWARGRGLKPKDQQIISHKNRFLKVGMFSTHINFPMKISIPLSFSLVTQLETSFLSFFLLNLMEKNHSPHWFFLSLFPVQYTRPLFVVKWFLHTPDPIRTLKLSSFGQCLKERLLGNSWCCWLGFRFWHSNLELDTATLLP